MFKNFHREQGMGGSPMGQGMGPMGPGMGQGMGAGMGQSMGPGMGAGMGPMGPGMGQGMGAGMGPMGPGMGQGMGQSFSSADASLKSDVSKAIIGEVHAYNFYENLAKLAPNAQFRQAILRIQRDEARHYHWFTMILRGLGGQLPKVPAEEYPKTFKEGVKKAIRDELEAAAFYLDIASRATDHRIHMRFMHASHDEQRHASWFQYMLSQL